MLADGGIVGALLLVLAGVAVGRVVRREDVATSCAAAALVAFAVAGALDFDWHLAALGLLGGWVAGLASPPPAEPEGRDEPDGRALAVDDAGAATAEAVTAPWRSPQGAG